MVINDRDAKSAWAFTLLHELVHLWLGLSGVSGARVEAQVERFCNEVASEMLLPGAQLAALEADVYGPLDDLVRTVGQIARGRRLSRTMVALRLFTSGTITEPQWQALRGQFRQDWLAQRERDRVAREDQEGGPNYYVVRRQRIGSALLNLVRRMVADGALTPAKAGQVLGVRARNVAPLLQAA